MSDEEDYEEDEQDNNDGLILSIGEDGKAEIHKPEDYVEIKKEDMDLIEGFIKKYHNEFVKYCKEVKTE